jgi:Carboxypeptidase regulatory-like domain
MTKRWSRGLLLWVAALFVSMAAWAQSSTTGVIEGRVRDQAGNPIADATVTGMGNRSPSVAVTDKQGRYTLANLPPGNYKVRAEAPGESAVVLDGVVVSINTRTRVDVTLVAGQTETVTVTAETPVVDTKSVTTGGNFKVENFIDQLPVGRNLAASLTLAPGVQSGLGSGKGNYSMSGSSGLENSYVIDGLNITNTGYGGIGAYNSVYGSLGTGVTYDFLEEVQVKTGGIDVEFGQATGGVVNSVVKTGTNDVSGKIVTYAGVPTNEYKQASLFKGATNLQKGSWNDSASYDLGMSIGGPIVKDRLFYFIAFNPTEQKQTAAIQDLPLPASLAGTTQYPQAAEGTQTIKRSSNNYAGKLTWYANPNHRLELTAFGDPSTGGTGPQREFILPGGVTPNLDYAEGGGQSSINYGGNNYTLKYDAVFTPTLFMQAIVGRKDAKFTEDSVLNQSRYTDLRQLDCFLSPAFCSPGQTRDNAASWAYGGVGFFSTSTDVNNQAKVVLTWATGNNELKGGVEYDDISYTDLQNYSGTDIPVKFLRDGTVSGTVASALATPCANTGPPYAADCYVLLDLNGGLLANEQTLAGIPQWRSNRGRFNPNPGATSTKDLAIFLQDTWTFTPKWTVKAGVRANRQKISGTGSYTLNYHYVDGTSEVSPPDGTIGVTPITPGSYTFAWAYAPRIGMTWDAKGDGRSKVYANAARYYERVPNDLAIRDLTNEADLGTTTFNGWDLAAGQPTDQNVGSSIRGGQTSVLPGTKLPYVDEYVLGWQQELGRDVSLDIRGIYREQGRVLEDTQFNSVEATENYYTGYYFGSVAGGQIDRAPFPNDPGGPLGQAFGAYTLANPGQNTPAGFPHPSRIYKALEFVLTKRFADHWQFYGNLRFARIQGNYEGLFRNDNGQSDPNISSLFDFPDSPLLHGQYESGPLNTDVPYSLKLYGNYTFDNGINLGAGFSWAAGVPRTPLLAHPNGFYQDAGELPGYNPVYYWYTTTGCVTAAECFTTGNANQFFQDPGAVIPSSTYSFPHLFSSTLVKRGEFGRTPDTTSLDLSISWQKKFSRWATFGVGASVFNVLNFREANQFDDNVEIQSGVADPDYLRPIQFQDPRTLRIYANWSF